MSDIKLNYTTVTGGAGDFEISGKDLIESILPDMRPPIDAIYLEAEGPDNTKFIVSLTKNGLYVRLATVE